MISIRSTSFCIASVTIRFGHQVPILDRLINVLFGPQRFARGSQELGSSFIARHDCRSRPLASVLTYCVVYTYDKS